MPESGHIDLYLGGDLGRWVLQQLPDDSIHQAVTLDEEIAKLAAQRNLKTCTADANSEAFVCSPVGLSIHYPRILKPELIGRYQKLYNLHPGYLPYGRGYY